MISTSIFILIDITAKLFKKKVIYHIVFTAVVFEIVSDKKIVFKLKMTHFSVDTDISFIALTIWTFCCLLADNKF